jgi:hypothetical protein
VWLMDPGEPQRGPSAMLNISAYPNAADVCLASLSEVLETGVVPQRYFLSSRACSGILRRAEKRGKELPPALRRALITAAGHARHARQDPDSGPVTHPLDTDEYSIGVGAFRWKMGAKARSVGLAFEQAGSVETNVGGYAIASPGMSVRRLTPMECARLQGFPDDFLDIVYRGKGAADGNKYRALGNAMCVPVVRWILKRVVMVGAIR